MFKKIIFGSILALLIQSTYAGASTPPIEASSMLVYDIKNNNVLFEKDADEVRSAASLTKLMTAVVVIDANVDMDQTIKITNDDVDTLKHSHSRMPVGTELSRREMLHLALMSSENRAAHALARTTYPGGINTFVKRMNVMASKIGMTNSHFLDPTGLNPENKTTAQDLVKLLKKANSNPLIRELSTDDSKDIQVKRSTIHYKNTNPLVKSDAWDINVSKTGFIKEAGHCLTMIANVDDKPMAFVILNSGSNAGRIRDAILIKNWLVKD